MTTNRKYEPYFLRTFLPPHFFIFAISHFLTERKNLNLVDEVLIMVDDVRVFTFILLANHFPDIQS